MMRQMWCAVSLGGRYMTSTVAYVGLALVVASVTPDTGTALAQTGGCDGGNLQCPANTFCCNGACIAAGDVCCDDGTSGPSTTADGKACGCCTGCNSQCSSPSTYKCTP